MIALSIIALLFMSILISEPRDLIPSPHARNANIRNVVDNK